MLKFTLLAAVFVFLSAGSTFSQQIGEPIRLEGPRRTNVQDMKKDTEPSLLARNLDEKSSETEVSSSSRAVKLTLGSSLVEVGGNTDDRRKPGDNISSKRHLNGVMMPGAHEGLGMSVWIKRPENGDSESLVERKRMDSLVMPNTFLKGLGNLASVPPAKVEKSQVPETPVWKRLEIEVSHSSHVFTLFHERSDGTRETLYECKIGLGAPEFPTPVGVYYVTHIYDQDPWWIPPANRAWAAGDSPSQRVYGGTMAPLLKKKVMSVRKKEKGRERAHEDFVENQVKLEDYGYRFHGTNQPRSIGRNQSHGCVRMLSDDAKKVSNLIKDHVGALDRRESENGPFVVLNAPVILNLVR